MSADATDTLIANLRGAAKIEDAVLFGEVEKSGMMTEPADRFSRNGNLLREAADAIASLTRELEVMRALCGEAAELYGRGGVFPINGEMSCRLEMAAQGMSLSSALPSQDEKQT